MPACATGMNGLSCGAWSSGDGGSFVTMLTREAWPDHALQLIGDGLLGVLAARADGVAELARRCVIGLRERGWEGDGELAGCIEAALKSGPVPLLRPVPVDLEELVGVLEGDPVTGGGRMDMRTGEVWPQPAIEYAEETGDFDEDDEERWLWVECEGSRAGYRDMEPFIAAVEDSGQADRLSIATGGRGACRRSKDVLSRWPVLLDRGSCSVWTPSVPTPIRAMRRPWMTRRCARFLIVNWKSWHV